MNLPNKLTVFRVVLIPFFVFFLLASEALIGGFGNYIALGIFIIACATDFADGKIARKYNLVTNFGKFMDPLADKLLVCTALICLVDLHTRLDSWIVMIIIAREFIISGFRLIASDNGVVIAASYWGKWKTFIQMLMVGALILSYGSYGLENFAFFACWWKYLEYVLIYVSLALTIISLLDYVIKNRHVLKDDK